MEVKLDRCTVRITTNESKHSNHYLLKKQGKKGVKKMQFGEGIIFTLTKEDIVSLAEEAGYTKDVMGDEFIEVIKSGIGDLVSIEIKKYLREIME